MNHYKEIGEIIQLRIELSVLKKEVPFAIFPFPFNGLFLFCELEVLNTWQLEVTSSKQPFLMNNYYDFKFVAFVFVDTL